MNRRSFLLGLLSTTAVPVVARAMPLAPLPPGNYLMEIESAMYRKVGEMSQLIASTLIYGTDEMPRRFVGFYMNVPIYETDEPIDEAEISLSWRKING